jgi:indole-3-glycerol phosphate synthase
VTSLLDDLLAATRARLAAARAALPAEVLEQRLAAQEPPRGFAAALAGARPALIAEIKRASPLKGPLAPGLNAGELARAYASGGAAALSVLTIPDGFSGSLDDLGAARAAGLPVLRKDFTLDPYQLLEARAWGADAVLIVVRTVGDELAELIAGAAALGLDALVEVHDEGELGRALDAGAELIGVNQRDLASFEVDPGRALRLAPLVPEGVTLVALSGVSRRSEVEALAAAGVQAVLVGEALVTASDPAAELRALRGVT